MEDFKDQVKRGFNNCRLDIEDLQEENSKLKETIRQLSNDNNSLKEEVSSLNGSITELKAEMKGINIALNLIKEFSEKQSQNMTQIPSVAQEVEPAPITTPKPMPVRPQASEDPYEALLAFKAKANKREILKQKLISMVTQMGINLSELKFLFVDHYKYCSKATFYNYLKELELERSIKIERENSKNFVFLYNSLEKEI